MFTVKLKDKPLIELKIDAADRLTLIEILWNDLNIPTHEVVYVKDEQ